MADQEKIEIDLVSPEKQVFSKVADMVIVSGTEGDFGVLPGHAPIVSSIRPGPLEIQDSNNTERFFLAGGIVEVLEDRVSILATEVFVQDDIQIENCESKISELTSEMQNMSSEEEKENSQIQIEKYQAMIDFKNS